MRELNHAHCFVVPLDTGTALPLDRFEPGLSSVRAAFAGDDALHAVAEQMGDRYRSAGGPLVHGDYFPGSWLRTDAGIRIIDPEFCFQGDREIDVACAVAHLVLARQPPAVAAALSRRLRLRRVRSRRDRTLCRPGDRAATDRCRAASDRADGALASRGARARAPRGAGRQPRAAVGPAHDGAVHRHRRELGHRARDRDRPRTRWRRGDARLPQPRARRGGCGGDPRRHRQPARGPRRLRRRRPAGGPRLLRRAACGRGAHRRARQQCRGLRSPPRPDGRRARGRCSR